MKKNEIYPLWQSLFLKIFPHGNTPILFLCYRSLRVLKLKTIALPSKLQKKIKDTPFIYAIKNAMKYIMYFIKFAISTIMKSVNGYTSQFN